MTAKTVPFSAAELKRIVGRHPTPFHIYDEKAIRENARGLLRAFAWAPGFREYFAVKACPNPHILKILREEGFGADCSSLPELLLAQKAGITGEDIMFTSNDTPAEEYRQARALGAVINLDDISHIPFLAEAGRAARAALPAATTRARCGKATPSSASPRRPSTASPASSCSRATGSCGTRG